MLSSASRETKTSRAFLFALGLAALLWCYTIVRAAKLSFTHDESLSYLHAIRRPVWTQLRFEVANPSNHHLLNSLLAKATSQLSTSPFALRLPNVLAHGAYLAAALCIARRARTPAGVLLGFVVLTLNPFMLDFFSMCRGYGLACGFQLLALWLWLRTQQGPDIRPWALAGASAVAALSVLSNLSFLVFFLAFVGCVAALALTRWIQSYRAGEARSSQLARTLALQALVAGALCAFVVPIGLRLRARGELYYGGESGFVQDTLGSLLEATSYYLPLPDAVRVGVGLWVGLLLAAALGLAARAAARGEALPTLFVCLLPLLTASICAVQHRLMATKFPVDRTALFFVPLFALALVEASQLAQPRLAAPLLLGSTALLLTLNASRALNVRYFAQWPFDANTADMLKVLAKQRGSNAQVRLGIHWLFEPTINYYRKRHRLRWLEPVTRAGVGDDYDFYYYLPEDAAALAPRKLTRLAQYDPSRATLARHER